MSARSYRGRPTPRQPQQRQRNSPAVCLVLALLLALPLVAAAQAQLVLGEADGPAGAAVSLPFSLIANTTQPSTLLLRVAYPAASIEVIDVQPTALLAVTGHSLDFEVTAPGELRVIFVGPGPMLDGELCHLLLRIAPAAGFGETFALTNAGTNGSTPGGEPLILEFYPGSVAVIALGGNHTADQDQDWRLSLSELLRVIQLYNLNEYHCDAEGEDGYAPGPGDQSCTEHDSDYAPSNWTVSLSELLRAIQFFNTLSGAYHPDANGEDGFAPGAFA